MAAHRKRDADRRRLIAQWERSEQTAAAFAEAHGIALSSLYAWRRAIERPASAPKPRARRVRMVPVRLVPDAHERDGAIEITLATGDRVSVRGDVAAEVLQRVVDTLRRRSC